MRKIFVKTCLAATLMCGMLSYTGTEVKASNYNKMVIANVNDTLNIRQKASASSKVVGEMKRGAVGTIISKSGNWIKIKSGSVTGYVLKDYILTGDDLEEFARKNVKVKSAKVTATTLNVRAKASTKAKTLGRLKKGQTITVKAVGEKWVRITYKNKIGYISKEYASITYNFKNATASTSSNATVSVSSSGTSVVSSTSSSSSKYKNLVLSTASSLNIRQKASTSSKVVGKLKKNAVATKVSTSGSWTKIKSGSITGYVSNDYIISGDAIEEYARKNVKVKSAKITATTLNVRASASTKAKTLGKLKKGQKITVKAVGKKWVRFSYNNKNGYILKEYVDITYNFGSATAASSVDSSVTVSGGKTDTVTGSNPNGNTVNTQELREEIVEYALRFVGNPYKWGGTSLTNGADCSGFVQTIYAKFGIKLDRVSYEQATNGRKISLSELQPGDLIFYIGSGYSRVSHVSIYIGNNQVVHALNSSKGICISNLYYNTPYVVRNVID